MISSALISGRQLLTPFPGFSLLREPWERGQRVLVDKSTDHENDVMVVQLCISFSRARVIQKNYNFKTVKVIVKKQSKTTIHGLYSYRPLKCRQNVQNFAVRPLACGSWFHLSFEHVDVICMVDNSRPGKIVVDLLNVRSAKCSPVRHP